jgi:hypothetical protein
MPRPSRSARPIALALLLALPAPASARPVEGVEVLEAVELAAHPLVLNGAGLRTKFFFKVYVAALYLPSRRSDAGAILRADEPWQVTVTFLRDVDHDRIIESFVHAFEKNSPGQLDRLRPLLARFHAILQDLKRGQVMVVHYLPGQGTTLTVPGGATATVPGLEFATAILRNWLGEHPADPDLERAMLGR